MSSIKRVISGSLASWFRILVGITSQVVAVPLYLHKWSVEEYGAWLLIQTVIGLMTIADTAYQNYLGFEFLKIGKNKPSEIASFFCSSLPVAFLVSLIPFAGLTYLVYSQTIRQWAGINPDFSAEFEQGLWVMSATWILTGSAGGVIGRVLYPFDCYPILAWGGAFYSIISTVAPVLAVSFFDANILDVAVVASVANVLFNIGLMSILIPRVRKENLFKGRISLYLGFTMYAKSLVLAAQNGLEMLRQHGARLILMMVADMSQMAAFSTMRTGSNFALQGLNTVTGPIMPELMRFLSARDQHKAESTFAVVWLVLCLVLAPAVITVQFFAPILFPLWTHGKIPFDPWLFGMLSTGVLVYALAQPAIAVIQGNNILRPQFFISLFAAIITVGGMYVLVPLEGIRGAAFALLVAELISMLSYLLVANQWLRQNGMFWPWRAFSVAFVAVMVAASGMAGLAEFSELKLECLSGALSLEALVVLAYWHCLPLVARQRAGGLLGRFIPARAKRKSGT